MMNHPKMRYTYLGVDSHKDTHCIVAINCFYEKLGTVTVKNSPSSMEQLLEEVKKFKQKGTSLAFGLEDVSEYGRQLAAFLKEKKFIVKHVNSYLVAHERKSLNIIQKTDEFDAECAARVLLNRFDTLPKADTQDKYWILKALVTHRESIVKNNIALKNRLHALIPSHYPSYSKFFCNIDTKGAIEFYKKYPSPSKLKGVTEEELNKLLVSVSGRSNPKDKAKKILEYVEGDGDTSIEYQDMRDLAVQSTIKLLETNITELAEVDKKLKELLGHFEYKLISIRGVDTVLAATLISEIGDITRFSTSAKLARYSGVAPTTYASGKSELQFADRRGNKALHHAFHTLAVGMISTAGNTIRNKYFYDYFHKKLSEGKTKRQALNCLQRRLVNIVWGMMTYGTEYRNPELELVAKADKTGTE
jgi:transposase